MRGAGCGVPLRGGFPRPAPSRTGAPPQTPLLAFTRGDGLVCAVNFGTGPVPAPVAGTPLLASGPCVNGVLPGSTAAWWISDNAAL